MKAVYRHALKSITWRIVGTADTIIISRFITGSWVAGLSIGGIELITKMLLYFLHERAWRFIIKKRIMNSELKKARNKMVKLWLMTFAIHLICFLIGYSLADAVDMPLFAILHFAWFVIYTVIFLIGFFKPKLWIKK